MINYGKNRLSSRSLIASLLCVMMLGDAAHVVAQQADKKEDIKIPASALAKFLPLVNKSIEQHAATEKTTSGDAKKKPKKGAKGKKGRGAGRSLRRRQGKTRPVGKKGKRKGSSRRARRAARGQKGNKKAGSKKAAKRQGRGKKKGNKKAAKKVAKQAVAKKAVETEVANQATAAQ